MATSMLNAAGALALALAVLLSACNGAGRDDTLADGATDMAPGDSTPAQAMTPDGAPPGPTPATAAAAMPPGTTSPTLTIIDGPNGQYLGNSANNAMYTLAGDRDGSKCTGDCIQTWPPVTIGDVRPTGAPGLQGAMIATVTRPEGTRQVTFNGHPLYRYAGDAGAGTTNGHGVDDKYGHWTMLTPQGEPFAASK